MKRLILAMTMCLAPTCLVSANSTVDGVTSNAQTVIDSIGKWDTVADNGIILTVDGKTQYLVREWSEKDSVQPYSNRQSSDGLDGNLFRFVGRNGEQNIDLKSGSIEKINNSLLEYGGILKVNDNLGIEINTVNLKNNFDSEYYTIGLSFAENGVWQGEQYSYVGSDLVGGKESESLQKLITSGTVISPESFGKESCGNWKGPSMKVTLTSAKSIKLDAQDGSCSLAEVPVYSDNGKWTVGTEIQQAIPDDEELKFAGWYTEEEDGEKVILGSQLSNEVETLYAHYIDAEDEEDDFVSNLEIGDVLTIDGIKYKLKTLEEGYGTAYACAVKDNSITDINIPGSFTVDNFKIKITGIERKAFLNCKKVQSLVLGSNVRTIGNKAFKGCKKLKRVEIKSKVLYSIGKKAFNGVSTKCMYVLPRSKRNQYVKLIKASKR